VEVDCEPPVPAEIGDVWYCPGCARKWHYTLFVDEEEDVTAEAWFTTEIG
jgi:hypothetical protein